jgi:heme exporter protein D
MAFDSFDAFVMMGGHGPYVWTCYIVFFILSFVLILWSRKQRHAALKGLALRQASGQAGKIVTSHGNTGADFARVDPSKH